MSNSTRERLTVLITGPSLDRRENVSGISSVVSNIIRGSEALNLPVNFEHIRLGSPDGKRGGQLFGTVLNWLGAISKVVFANGDSVVHLNLALNTKSVIRDSAIAAAAFLSRKVVLTHTHGGHYLEKPAPFLVNLLIQAVFQISSKVVVLSHIERGKIEFSYGRSRGKVSVVYNGVDLSGVRDADVDTGIPGQLRVAFVGRLEAEKGVAHLMTIARAGLEGVTFSVAGRGSLSDELAAAQLSSLSLLGVLGPGDLQALLLHSDALLLPSDAGEGMPMAVIEAMAAGVIPVVTRIASLPEIVDEARSGFLVAVGDVEGMTNALVKLRDDYRSRIEMKSQAKADAFGRHDMATMAGNLFQIYEGIHRAGR